jgi:hypothetical protein
MAHATPDARRDTTARVFVILAFVFGAVAILFLPIIFGPAAIILAVIGLQKGDPLGRWAVGFAIAATIAGFALGFLVYNANT